MTNQEKFKRFCVAWIAYLVGSFVLLRWVLVPHFGEIPVIVGVAIGLLAWVIGFFKWGPIFGNWYTSKQKKHNTQ